MLLIKQIPVKNLLRNYMYLLACSNSNRAVAIDPLDHQLCLETASILGWQIEAVINTHEHHDHIGGNQPVIEQTGATLYAHHAAVDKIPNVDIALHAGDKIAIGDEIELVSLDTPGHTLCHTCLYYQGVEKDGGDPDAPAIFSGDTLFNAGVGNCHNGGDPKVMYQTFVEP